MTADAETLVVAAYVFATELPSPAPVGRPPLVADEELIALAVAQVASGICSDRHFLTLGDGSAALIADKGLWGAE